MKKARHTKAEATPIPAALVILHVGQLCQPLRKLLIHRLAERRTWKDCGELLKADIEAMPADEDRAEFSNYANGTPHRAKLAFREAVGAVRRWIGQQPRTEPSMPQRRHHPKPQPELFT